MDLICDNGIRGGTDHTALFCKIPVVSGEGKWEVWIIPHAASVEWILPEPG